MICYLCRRLFTVLDDVKYSVADPGCLSRIPVSNFFHPGSEFFHPVSEFFHPGSEFFHPGSWIRIKEIKYFNPKNGFYALGNMIRVVHPGSGSRIRIMTFHPSRIPDPGVKRAPDPGSRTRIRNTGKIKNPSSLIIKINGKLL
jgi:hypothetical protein